MGIKYRPEDIFKRKKMIEKGLRDLDPGLRDLGRRLIEYYDTIEVLTILRNHPDEFRGLSPEEAIKKLKEKYGIR
ncbi:MAG: hypothetical protein DRJ38_07675 [Thermoprotei archaeon]|nr:MAG: hypothetical protein DRJ38_07675 [Thermoprotei archaeon]